MQLVKSSLPVQMALATLLGIFCGLFFGELCGVFEAWASAYIMLLKVTTIPYLIATIIHGVGQLSSMQAKAILKKGLLFIALAWATNIAAVYLTVFLFPHSKVAHGMSHFASDTPPINFAELLIPENIFYDLSNNIVPSIVIFSLLLGLALMQLKEKYTMMSLLGTVEEVLTRITSWISRITPMGTFIIIAHQVGTIQITTIQQVSTYVILYILSTCLVTFWIFPRLAGTLTPLSSSEWLKGLLPILLLAYTTNVVIICLPYIIALLQKQIGALYPEEESAKHQAQGVVSVVYNIPLGSLFITLFVFFAAIFYKVPLPLAKQVQLFLTTFLTSLGSIGIGAWINNLTFLLDSLGLPSEGVHLYLTTLPFTAGFQSMVSAMEITTISFFITLASHYSYRKWQIWRWKRILKKCIVTLLPLFLLMVFFKSYNPFPPIQSSSQTIYDIGLSSSLNPKVYTAPTSPLPINAFEDPLDRILRTKTLRVGYNPNVPPFCFYNEEKKLVGYDMAFAHELAKDLGCSLELVPLSYAHLQEELQAHMYDIGMAAVSLTEERLAHLFFSPSYVTSRLVFLVANPEHKKLPSFEEILSHPTRKIAVLKGSSFEKTALTLVPSHRLLLLESPLEFSPNSSAANEAALLWEEHEALAWMIKHPHLHPVFPKASCSSCYKDTLAYAIAPGASRFRYFLEQWLRLKENQGFTRQQYELWVLGKLEHVSPPPRRWSILQDLLGWDF